MRNYCRKLFWSEILPLGVATGLGYAAYNYKGVISPKLEQLYQMLPTQDVVQTMGANFLNRTSTVLGNACINLGQAVSSSSDKTQQAGAGLLVGAAMAIAFAVAYKARCVRSAAGVIGAIGISRIAYDHKDFMYSKMQQVYQAMPSQEVIMKKGGELLSSTPTFIGNAATALGKKVINSDDKQQQIGAAIAVVILSAVTLAAIYKCCCRSRKLSAAELRNKRMDRFKAARDASQQVSVDGEEVSEAEQMDLDLALAASLEGANQSAQPAHVVAPTFPTPSAPPPPAQPNQYQPYLQPVPQYQPYVHQAVPANASHDWLPPFAPNFIQNHYAPYVEQTPTKAQQIKSDRELALRLAAAER